MPPTAPDYVALLKDTRRIVEQTAAQIMQMRAEWKPSQTKFKPDTSLVTHMDVASERMLVQQLAPLVPGCAFLAEEEHEAEVDRHDYVWVIDPIDGTTNFVHGIPAFCISVALMERGRVVMGVVHEMNLSETFYACEGVEGAFLNGKPIHCTETKELKNCLVATGFPTVAMGRFEEYMAILKHLIPASRGIRRIGAAALDLAYVAAGRFDGYWETDLKPWDMAAGAYLVLKAGGKATDYRGNRLQCKGEEIIASNPLVYDQIREIIIKYAGQ